MDYKGQELLREFELSDVCESEVDWTNEYVNGEFDANDNLIINGQLVPIVYKLHDVPMESYKVGREQVMSYGDYFFQSLEAKADVGKSTNDSWVFAMILEAYEEFSRKNNFIYMVNKEPVNMIRLNRSKFFEFHSAYIRGLQDYVVSAIKHADNGSSNFDNLLLKNMADESNRKKVFAILTDNLNLTPTQANEILRIISWASVTGVYSAASSFLRYYNKGNPPRTDDAKAYLDQHEHFIQRGTYFGRLMKPVYDVIQTHKEKQGFTTSRRSEELAKLLANI